MKVYNVFAYNETSALRVLATNKKQALAVAIEYRDSRPMPQYGGGYYGAEGAGCDGPSYMRPRIVTPSDNPVVCVARDQKRSDLINPPV